MTDPCSSKALIWLRTLRRYLLFAALANLIWETAQIPLFTLGSRGTIAEIAFAVVHCAAGDVVIAFACLAGALVSVGSEHWPTERFGAVSAAAVALGVTYTVYSEWANVVRGAWAYSQAMPTLPPLGTGLAPLLQWLVLPPAGLVWARSRATRTLGA